MKIIDSLKQSIRFARGDKATCRTTQFTAEQLRKFQERPSAQDEAKKLLKPYYRENELRQMLAELQRSYSRAAEPIVNELVRLENLKPPKLMIIPIEWPEGQEPPLIRKLLEDVDRMVKSTTGLDLLQ
jgi:hypothetical protein